MLEQELDFGLDQIEVSINIEDSSVEDVKFPHLYITNIVLNDQIRGLVDDPNSELFTVHAYGEKNGSSKYIGKIELTATNVMMMRFFGLGVKLIKNASGASDDFSTPESLVSIIKTLRGSDTLAITDSDIPIDAGG